MTDGCACLHYRVTRNDICLEIVVAIQSKIEGMLVEIIDGEQGLSNEVRRRCRSVEITLRTSGHSDRVAAGVFW